MAWFGFRHACDRSATSARALAACDMGHGEWSWAGGNVRTHNGGYGLHGGSRGRPDR
jgi:hypothetical protein